MEIILNPQTRTYSVEATRAELEIIQIAICSNMAQIPKDMKEERKKTAEMGVTNDKALATI
jgi:hypothetical protein